MAEMKTLYHPTLSATVEVPEAQVDSWVASGWRKTKPKSEGDSGDK